MQMRAQCLEELEGHVYEGDLLNIPDEPSEIKVIIHCPNAVEVGDVVAAKAAAKKLKGKKGKKGKKGGKGSKNISKRVREVEFANPPDDEAGGLLTAACNTASGDMSFESEAGEV